VNIIPRSPTKLLNLFQDDEQMPWPTPLFTRNEVNKAGRILASSDPNSDDLEWAHQVLANWRACHGYPINTFQSTLRDKLESLDLKDSIVAQRLKRTPSIIGKLRRFDKMQLARMQDIGGLRAVVSSLADARQLQIAYKKSRFKHELVTEKDYITAPKPDGYRGIHLVFRYKNPVAPAYEGLAVELQIRTKLQHTWATAVETMSTFLGEALKARQGSEQWLKFFEVTGSAFAYLENCPLVRGYENLSKDETFQRVSIAERELSVLDKLQAFSFALQGLIKPGQGTYHLIVLDTSNKTVEVQPYAKADLQKAVDDYMASEARAEKGEKIEAVLVAAGPITLLRKAYPNYFLDTTAFVDHVRQIISLAPGKS
jgi:ppGpp synthetase/RelA/SpoT-type nucleotidyltranferase